MAPGTLTFDALPLLEVTLKVAPSEPVPVDLQTVLTVCRRLSRLGFARPEFVHVPLPGIGTASLTPPRIMPCGVRMFDPERRVEVVWQSNLLVATWKNETLHPDVQYVRYAALRRAMVSLLRLLRLLRGGVRPPTQAVNLSYVNFIRTENAPVGRNAEEFLVPSLVPREVDRENLFNEVNHCWRESGGADLRIQLRRILATGDESVHGMVLTTVAGCAFQPGRNPLKQADRCHHLLVTRFTTVITDHAKEVWGMRYE